MHMVKCFQPSERFQRWLPYLFLSKQHKENNLHKSAPLLSLLVLVLLKLLCSVQQSSASSSNAKHTNFRTKSAHTDTQVNSLARSSGIEWLYWARCRWTSPRSWTCRSRCGSPACPWACRRTGPSTGPSTCGPGPGTAPAESPSGWSPAAPGRRLPLTAAWSRRTSQGRRWRLWRKVLTDSEEDVVGGPGTCCWGCDFLYPVGAGFGCRKLPPGEKRVTYFIMIMAGWKWFCRTHFILSSRTPELFTKHCGLLKIRS